MLQRTWAVQMEVTSNLELLLLLLYAFYWLDKLYSDIVMKLY